MKFLLLANNDYDGIGQTLINLSLNLEKLNQKVEIALLHSRTKKKGIKIIKRLFIFRIVSFLLNFLKLKEIKSYKKNFLELFWFGNTTIDYESIKNDISESDIIIIFTFHKIISNKIFEKIMKSKKVVFLRPLDLELATGGCHFNDDCQKFNDNCNQCPKLNFFNFFNITKKNLIEKKRIVEKYNPKVLVQNTYVQNIFQKSSVFQNSQTDIVRLETRRERKKIYTKDVARRILKLDNKENLILFGAFDLSSHLKGGDILLRSLDFLESKYLEQEKGKKNYKDLRLLTIGKKNKFALDSKIVKWTHLGLINSDEKLNLLYRAADLLVCPSLRCFAPHIVSEATENNLPVIAFDVGVAQDDIINEKNGFLVPCYDISIFAKSIYQALYNQKVRNEINNGIKENSDFDRTYNEAYSIIQLAEKSLKERNTISKNLD